MGLCYINFMSLDLYAKSEHLLGIEEATEHLHVTYSDLLRRHGVKSVLDIGCGRGLLMQRLAAQGLTCKGIDLSEEMVNAAKANGLDASCCDIKDATGTFDAVVAVFDVLNFIAPDDMASFLDAVAQRLKPDGLFIADINTLKGFSDVAQGVMVAEDETLFLSVDAVFEANEPHTEFTLFEHFNDTCYNKSQGRIIQYYYPISRFKKVAPLHLAEKRTLSLYESEDKMLLVFKKECC